MDFKELSFKRLQERVKRLQMLINTKAPSVIIANEVVLIMKAAIGYCGRDFTDSLLGWLYPSLCTDNGFCQECRKNQISELDKKARRLGLCDDCLKSFEEEERGS